MVMTTAPSVPKDAWDRNGETAHVEVENRSTIVAYGALDHAHSAKLYASLSRAIARSPHVVLVDLANVSFIDTAGLGALVSADRQLRARGGHLHVVAASDQVAETLVEYGLSDRFPHLTSVDGTGWRS